MEIDFDQDTNGALNSNAGVASCAEYIDSEDLLSCGHSVEDNLNNKSLLVGISSKIENMIHTVSRSNKRHCPGRINNDESRDTAG